MLAVLMVATNTWTEVQATGDAPEPRSGHSLVVFGDSMYVFGGRNKEPQYFRDIHRFDFSTCFSIQYYLSRARSNGHYKRIETRTWSLLNVPGPVYPPCTYNHASFAYRNSLYIFGGYGSEGTDSGPRIGHRHSELYEFNIGT